jgi:hypothetical protein
MKILLIFVLFFFLPKVLSAQKGRESYQVGSATDVNKVIPYAGRYQYPAFTDGQVHFRNGKTSNAKMNYNLVHGEVMFISLLRDTLLFADNNFVDRVQIGNSVYYYNPGHGHIEIAGNYGDIKLGKKQFLAQLGHEKYAAYGQYSSTAAISSYSTFMNKQGEFRYLDTNEKVLMKRRAVYFLIDKNQRFYLANRANLLKIFPSQKSAISRFLRDNEINLEVEPDLEKTLEFCSTLSLR